MGAPSSSLRLSNEIQAEVKQPAKHPKCGQSNRTSSKSFFNQSRAKSPQSCSYLSRYFSEKSTMVSNIGSGMNAAAWKHMSGMAAVRTQGFVWQSHSSHPREALLELYIVQGVWRRRTLGSPNPQAALRRWTPSAWGLKSFFFFLKLR